MVDNGTSKRAILVTGATGKQGGATIDALINAGAPNTHILMAVTRDPASTTAKKLESRGVVLVQGDLDNCPAIFARAKAALGGGKSAKIWGVFSVQALSPKHEETQGKAMADAALANHVEYFVYTSVDRGGEMRSLTNPTNVPHFRSKHNIEQHLLAATGEEKTNSTTHKMKWVILRPVAFMENLTPGFAAKIVATAWRLYLGKKTIQLVAAKDIGWFAAQALLRPEEFAGRSISLAGDELTYKQISDVFQAKTGHSIPETLPLLARLIVWLVSDVGNMIRWFAAEGYGADIVALRTQYPELLSLGEWVEQSEWVKK